MAVYSDILKELRRDKHMTQAEMGKHFNIAASTYALYENGNRHMKIDMLCRLADILETSTDYILGRTNESKPYPARKQHHPHQP